MNTIQCKFKASRQSNAISRKSDNPMQFQSKRTIQSNLKVSRQSNAIFKASRQSNASSNFKSSGLCVWATGPWWHDRHDASYVWSTSTRGWTTISTSYSIIIQCTISNIDRRMYHKNITICTLCNHNMCKVQCVNHNAITICAMCEPQCNHNGPNCPRTVMARAHRTDSGKFSADSESVRRLRVSVQWLRFEESASIWPKLRSKENILDIFLNFCANFFVAISPLHL